MSVHPDPDRDPDHAVAAALRDARFEIVRVREGYDPGQVDSFIAAAASDLESDSPRMGVHQVESAQFTTARLRDGYDPEAVDHALTQLRDYLDLLERFGYDDPPLTLPAPPARTRPGSSPVGRRTALVLYVAALVALTVASYLYYSRAGAVA